MKTVLSVDLGEIFGGSDFDIPMILSAAEFSMDRAGNTKYTDLALQVSIPLLGNMSLKGDGYTDAAEEYSYSYTKEFTMEGGLFGLAGYAAETGEDLNRWIRKKEEKKPDEETEKKPDGETEKRTLSFPWIRRRSAGSISTRTTAPISSISGRRS